MGCFALPMGWVGARGAIPKNSHCPPTLTSFYGCIWPLTLTKWEDFADDIWHLDDFHLVKFSKLLTFLTTALSQNLVSHRQRKLLHKIEKLYRKFQNHKLNTCFWQLDRTVDNNTARKLSPSRCHKILWGPLTPFLKQITLTKWKLNKNLVENFNQRNPF